jgi:DNA topoisomerase-3
VGKAILEQPVSREQMVRLLTEGRTEKLEHFVSRKTGRPFAAFLVLDEQGKVTFEFPPR